MSGGGVGVYVRVFPCVCITCIYTTILNPTNTHLHMKFSSALTVCIYLQTEYSIFHYNHCNNIMQRKDKTY